MEDKSLFTGSQPQGISEGLQNFINSMVEEIVLEGKPFDTQKKYLKKYSESEGLDYVKLEADITTFIEILNSLRTSFSNLQVKLAEEKGRECHISEDTVKNLLHYSSQYNPPKKENKTKTGLWIGLGLAVVAIAVLIVLSVKPKPVPTDPDTQAFMVCRTVDDYRNYISQFGETGKHYAEAKSFIEAFVNDSIQQAKNDKLLALQNEPFFPFSENGKWGYIDHNGNIVLPPQYHNIGAEFHEGLCAFFENGKLGFINKLGDTVIAPQFDWGYYFSNGFAAVKSSNGLWGIIDKNGNMVTELKFESADIFSEGLCSVRIGNKYGFIDTTGNMVIEPQYEYAFDFYEDLAAVKINGKWGFIDKNGRVVIEPQYEDTYGFSEGLAPVKLNGHWGYINNTGRMVIEPEYIIAEKFSDNMAFVTICEGYDKFPTICINKSGEKILPKEGQYYYRYKSFSEGLAIVSTDMVSYQYINKAGQTVFSDFHEAEPFHNGLAKVQYSNGSKSYIDKSGKTVFTWY